MSQIKKTDIMEPGNPFADVTAGIKGLNEMFAKLTTESVQLRNALDTVAKTQDGKEAKALIAITDDLVKKTEQLAKVEKATAVALQAEQKVMQELEKTKREQIKTEQAVIKAKEQAEKAAKKEAEAFDVASDSLKGMERELAKLRKEYSLLTKEQVKADKESGNLLKTINKLDAETKDLRKSMGQAQGNVGNYKDAIKEAAAETGLFAQANNATGGALGVLRVGLSTATKGMTAFKIALISTGIGAIFVALGLAIGGVVAYFKRFDEGQEAIERFSAGVSAAINTIIEQFSAFAQGMGMILSGQFVAGWAVLNGSLKKVGDSFKAASEAAGELQKIEDEQRQLSVERSEMDRKIAEARVIYADEETYSLEERLKAIQEVQAAETEMLRKETDVAYRYYLERKKIRENDAAQSDENKDAEADALIEYNNLYEKSAADTRKLLKQENSLKDEIEKRNKERYDGEIKRKEELAEAERLRLEAEAEAEAAAIKLRNEGNEATYIAAFNTVKAGEELRKKETNAIVAELQKRLEIQKAYAALEEIEQKKKDARNLEAINTASDALSEVLIYMATETDATIKGMLELTVLGIVDTIKAIVNGLIVELAAKAVADIANQNYTGAALKFAGITALKTGVGGVETLVRRGFESKDNKKKKAFADGGLVVGEGSGKSDSIDAKLSNGEFVQTADTVRKSGNLIRAMHRGDLTDANAATYINNVHDSKLRGLMEKNNSLLANLGYAYSPEQTVIIQKANGQTIKIVS